VKSKKTATQKLFWIRRKRKFSMMKAIQSCTRIGQNPARPENKILLPEKLPNEVKKSIQLASSTPSRNEPDITTKNLTESQTGKAKAGQKNVRRI
jgi:hypothetical protein